jgi:hypothetical protein
LGKVESAPEKGATVDPGNIESAYAPFVATLREGGFTTPAEGWPAELVAAHVCRNNDIVSEAAEAVAAGGQPKYDNSPAVDDAELRSYAESLGGLGGLAQAVEVSARRLASAFAALDDEAAGHLMPAVIVDSGRLVRDEPVAIGKFIELNASRHIEMHLFQLKALQS